MRKLLLAFLLPHMLLIYSAQAAETKRADVSCEYHGSYKFEFFLGQPDVMDQVSPGGYRVHYTLSGLSTDAVSYFKNQLQVPLTARGIENGVVDSFTINHLPDKEGKLVPNAIYASGYQEVMRCQFAPPPQQPPDPGKLLSMRILSRASETQWTATCIDGSQESISSNDLLEENFCPYDSAHQPGQHAAIRSELNILIQQNDETVIAYCKDGSSEENVGFNQLLKGTLCTPKMIPQAFLKKGKLALGEMHSCIVDAGVNFECWGENYNNRSVVPSQFGKAADAAVSYAATCVIDNDQVFCWGDNYQQPFEAAPAGKYLHPRRIAGGRNTFCVVHDAGTSCWRAGFKEVITFAVTDPMSVDVSDLAILLLRRDGGLETFPKDLDRPALKGSHSGIQFLDLNESHSYDNLCLLRDSILNCDKMTGLPTTRLTGVRQIATGRRHVCVLTTKVRCYGDNSLGQLDAPPMSKVLQIEADNDRTCAQTDKGLTCWGDHYHAPFFDFHPITTVYGFDGFYRHVLCAQGDGRVRCWGDDRARIFSVLETLDQVTQVWAINFHPSVYHEAQTACAVHDRRLSCWEILTEFDKDDGLGPRELDEIKPQGAVLDIALRPYGGLAILTENGIEHWSRGSRWKLDYVFQPAKKLESLVKYGSDTFVCGHGPDGISCFYKAGESLPGWSATDTYSGQLATFSEQSSGLYALNAEGKLFYRQISYGFDYTERNNASIPENLGHVLEIVTGETMKLSKEYVCVRTDSGVQCWCPGFRNDECEMDDVPLMTNPRSLSGSETSVCAVDETGLKCWGDYRWSMVPDASR